MTIINKFFEEIENVLFENPSNTDWKLFNELEYYFIDNNDLIFRENEKISDLVYDMQDIIAEMEYMDDFTECRKKIIEIFNKMKKEYNHYKHTMQQEKSRYGIIKGGKNMRNEKLNGLFEIIELILNKEPSIVDYLVDNIADKCEDISYVYDCRNDKEKLIKK